MDFIKNLQEKTGIDSVEELKEKAGELLDQIPGGLGDQIGDAIGIETAADRAAAENEASGSPEADPA